jgi:hypothetical protein
LVGAARVPHRPGRERARPCPTTALPIERGPHDSRPASIRSSFCTICTRINRYRAGRIGGRAGAVVRSGGATWGVVGVGGGGGLRHGLAEPCTFIRAVDPTTQPGKSHAPTRGAHAPSIHARTGSTASTHSSAAGRRRRPVKARPERTRRMSSWGPRPRCSGAKFTVGSGLLPAGATVFWTTQFTLARFAACTSCVPSAPSPSPTPPQPDPLHIPRPAPPTLPQAGQGPG